MKKTFLLTALACLSVLCACGSNGGQPLDVPGDAKSDVVDECNNQCGTTQVCFQGFCCDPFCSGRACGSDGCGGSCGDCPDTQACFNYVCCTPNCVGRSCGDDGCGGQCGECGDGLPCMNDGKCCVPVCGDAECGEDSCGRADGCGTCGDGFRCQDGSCCKQQCNGKSCGDDGCGGTCGSCGQDQFCETGKCRPKGCEGRWCDTGVGGVACGTCTGDGEVCFDGICCTPDCDGRTCGTDGCGGSCGACDGDLVCCFDGTDCCAPECAGRECGMDASGGYCGPECPLGSICRDDGQCCEPDCALKMCGDDGCGGSCGECLSGCRNFMCPMTTGECPNAYCEKCNPEVEDCEGKADETCRNCPADCGCTGKYECINDVCCIPDCGDRECGDNGCGVPCGLCGHGAVCNASGMCEPCDDECTPGETCTPDKTGVWECVYAQQGCNRKLSPEPCVNGCSDYINGCMNACPEEHGKCSAPGAYKCFSDAPQCVFVCPTDESIAAADRKWTILVNCSASGDTCVCGEIMEDISTCITNEVNMRACYGQRVH